MWLSVNPSSIIPGENQSYFYLGEESAFTRLLLNQQGTSPNQVLTHAAHKKGCGQSKQGTGP